MYRNTGAPKESKAILEKEETETVNDTGIAELGYWIDPETRAYFRVVGISGTEIKRKDKVERKFNAAGVLTETKEIGERESKSEEATDFLVGVDHRTGEAGKLALSLGYTGGGEIKDKGTETIKNSGFDGRTREEERKPEHLFMTKLDWAAEHAGAIDGIFKAGFLHDVRDRAKKKQTFSTSAAGLERETTNPKDRYDLRETINAVYALDEWEAVHDRLFVSPGVRVEWTDTKSFSGTGGSDDKSYEDVLPSMHLLWKAADRFDVEASYRKSLQRPKFDETAPSREESSTEIKEGNPDLKPAQSDNFEAGFNQWFDRFRYGVNGFHREIDNLIAEEGVGTDSATGKSIIRFQNTGTAWVRGLELEARVDPDEAWSVTANWTRLYSETRDDTTGRKGRLKEMPEWTGNLILDVRPDGTWWFQGTGHFIGPQEGVEFKRTEIVRKPRDAFQQFDLAVRKVLSKEVSVLLRVSDVFETNRREEKEAKRNLLEHLPNFCSGFHRKCRYP